jgi:hypothetical protein
VHVHSDEDELFILMYFFFAVFLSLVYPILQPGVAVLLLPYINV